MRPSVRIPLVLLVTAVAVSLGVEGVRAATQCVRFVEKKVPHHKVSAATAARWKAWDKAHPNWHPKKTPKETLAQLDFACAVPLVEKPAAEEEVAPLNVTAFDLPMDLLPPETDTTPVMVAMETFPPDPFPDQRTSDVVTPPIYMPQYPGLFGDLPAPPRQAVVPPAGLAPEPSSWMLLATSMLAMGVLATRRRQVAIAFARR